MKTTNFQNVLYDLQKFRKESYLKKNVLQDLFEFGARRLNSLAAAENSERSYRYMYKIIELPKFYFYYYRIFFKFQTLQISQTPNPRTIELCSIQHYT